MQLEDYLEFCTDGTIRVKGTRVGIDVILRDYLEGASPEEIVLRYPSLTLEQVHATITYYLHNKPEVDSYLRKCWEEGEKAWREQHEQPSEFVRNLRERLFCQREIEQKDGRLITLPRER